MATEPRTFKIQLKHERTEGIGERYPTSNAMYFITADKAEISISPPMSLPPPRRASKKGSTHYDNYIFNP